MNADKDKSDAELVLSFQSGDKTAWDALCSKYGPRIARFFYTRGIKNPEDVQDLVQGTLLEAMEQIHKIRKPESFRGWLFAIATGKMARWFAAQEKLNAYEPFDAEADDVLMDADVNYSSASPAPESIAINNEYTEIVLHLIAQLPQRQKEVIMLSAVGSPHKEIAETLNISVSNVKVLAKRGRDKLKTLLKAKYPDDFADIVGHDVMQSLLGEKPD